MAKKCKCGICGKEFKSLSARRRHKIKGHSKKIKLEDVKQMENKEEIVKEEVEEQKETLKEIHKIKMPKEQAETLLKEALEVCKGDEKKAIELLFSDKWNPIGKYLK